MDYKTEYDRWLKEAVDLHDELAALDNMEDAFYRNLEFGTGGLRGVIGVGTNRMNKYTVAKASQGLADYVSKRYPLKKKIAIAYDSRNQSDVFSKISAGVFAENGIHVYIYPELMPAPMLSFAVRFFQCAAGIVITASHNPSQYNGYKVYGADGCQVTTEAAEEILSEIEKLDIFHSVKWGFFENNPLIHVIGEDCCTAFTEEVKKQSVLFGDEINKDIAIVYSPLNGTGLKPLTRVLKESGYTNITVVKEQKQPDGSFPTCPYPNPEIEEALALGLSYAKKRNADLMLATDPDADRVGIAVNNHGAMKLLTGNEVGILLLDYLCSQRIKHGKMPEKPVFIKTIATTDMAEQIARHYGVDAINVLTGFKFIGEQIGFLEKNDERERFVFGFEESCGYLSGSYIRDKDAIGGAFLICEMYAYYKTRGVRLVERLDELYKEYGYCLCKLHTYEFLGPAGLIKMNGIMQSFRRYMPILGSKAIKQVLDYQSGLHGLPKSNVLKFLLDGNSSVVVRPSGTEPKIKCYISVSAASKQEAEVIERRIVEDLEHILS